MRCGERIKFLGIWESADDDDDTRVLGGGGSTKNAADDNGVAEARPARRLDATFTNFGSMMINFSTRFVGRPTLLLMICWIIFHSHGTIKRIINMRGVCLNGTFENLNSERMVTK